MSQRGRHVDPKGGQSYEAAALSIVLHSWHPKIPTLRADVRVFAVEGEQWYGGGCDLTPFYLFDADVAGFHRYWKGICDSSAAGLYEKYKAECDKYFYLPARKEHRGTGGIFFDDLDPKTANFEVDPFIKAVGEGFLPSWLPIAAHRREEPYSEAQRQWQLLRRGRYIEFNLLYDRGVRFGLEGGRMESIMVSAPPLIAWKYNAEPEPGTEEARLVEVLRKPREWV